MVRPVTPADKDLAKIANGDPYLVIALRDLFDQAGNDTPASTEEALLSAESALARASLAIAALNRIETLAELAALTPVTEVTLQDNIETIREPFSRDSLVDLAPI